MNHTRKERPEKVWSPIHLFADLPEFLQDENHTREERHEKV